MYFKNLDSESINEILNQLRSELFNRLRFNISDPSMIEVASYSHLKKKSISIPSYFTTNDSSLISLSKYLTRIAHNNIVDECKDDATVSSHYNYIAKFNKMNNRKHITADFELVGKIKSTSDKNHVILTVNWISQEKIEANDFTNSFPKEISLSVLPMKQGDYSEAVKKMDFSSYLLGVDE